MIVLRSISRVREYYKRHGLIASFRRSRLALGRELFAGQMVVFYCDLLKQAGPAVSVPAPLRIERVRMLSELSSSDLEKILSFWNPKQAYQDLQQRFANSASLWLIKSADSLAGFSWTITGRTIADYYFPLGEDDVQLFDFYVFPNFRGRAVLWFLIAVIMETLQAEGATRIFGDVAEWNTPSLSFYKMTPFRVLGIVKAYRLFGCSFVRWRANDARRSDLTIAHSTAGLRRPNDQIISRRLGRQSQR